jgi:hypothetical protein
MGRNTGNNNRAPGYVMNKDRYLLRSNHAKGNIHKNLPAVVCCLFIFKFFCIFVLLLFLFRFFVFFLALETNRVKQRTKRLLLLGCCRLSDPALDGGQ